MPKHKIMKPQIRITQSQVESLERHTPQVEYGECMCEPSCTCSEYPTMDSTRSVKSEGTGEWLRRDDVLALFQK